MTPIPGPIILLALPLLAAGGTYVVRRWAILASLLAALTTATLALLCLLLPLDRSAFVLGQEVAFGRPVVILGRNLILDPAGQAWLAFIFVLVTFLYLFAWRISQGRSFFSFSLVMLSLYGLIALLQSFSLAIIVFAISTTLAVFIIQGGQRATIRGAQRYLLVALLAVPFLLTAAWFADQSLLDPTNIEVARLSLLPAALGFGLLLAVFPFGTWMPALSADAPPIVTAFVFVAGQAMALYLALLFLRSAPWALTHPATPSVILLAGLVMAFSGGAMAAAQHDFGRLFGYAALSDLGILLLAFSSGGSQGLTLTLMHMVNRSVSITLLAASLSILRHRATTDDFARLQGAARRLPIAAFGLIMGGLALAGFPLTAGFPTHWAISRAILNAAQPFSPMAQKAGMVGIDAVSDQPWVWVATLLALLASSGGIVIGLLRGLSAMLGDSPRNDIARQPIIASAMVLVLVALALLLSLYPQLFLEPIRTTVEALSLF
jgi:formate hydrogenlyase subunit 3/multisubunit Na+/H+ antiporter MnhD subunit